MVEHFLQLWSNPREGGGGGGGPGRREGSEVSGGDLAHFKQAWTTSLPLIAFHKIRSLY